MRSGPRVTGDAVLRDYTGYWSTVVELLLGGRGNFDLLYVFNRKTVGIKFK